MENGKLLLVEDNQRYLEVAKEALGRYNPLVAVDYESAIANLQNTDLIITDLFYQREKDSSNREKGYEAIGRIRRGMTLPYIQETEKRLLERGVQCTPDLRASLEILALHKSLTSNKEKYPKAVIEYLSSFGEEGIHKLPSILEEMLIKKTVDKYIPRKFDGLREYMGASPENQPLGYLIAEEAEEQGKPFIIATSLRHAEAPLIPILDSANARGWKLLEGKDGSKEDPFFWIKAYQQLKEVDEK